jgi:hypothetical protein
MDHATIAERPLPFRSIGPFKDSVEVPELPCPHAAQGAGSSESVWIDGSFQSMIAARKPPSDRVILRVMLASVVVKPNRHYCSRPCPCESSRWVDGLVVFHIANDRLPAVTYMNVLNADELLPAAAQASKDFDLRRVSAH